MNFVFYQLGLICHAVMFTISPKESTVLEKSPGFDSWKEQRIDL